MTNPNTGTERLFLDALKDPSVTARAAARRYAEQVLRTCADAMEDPIKRQSLEADLNLLVETFVASVAS